LPDTAARAPADGVEGEVNPTYGEKLTLLAGEDDWHFRGIPRLGIPPMLVADCGHGVSLCGARTSPATCFPTGAGMACTWNPQLMEEVGRAIGRECRALGISMLLGPKVNLHRLPINGRCFETFSEDPLLAGTLGAGIIRGIQGEGVAACLKAAAANNQQHDQHHISSEVDERTLRELYLRVFEIAMRLSAPVALMTSYNLLNGFNAGESEWMIKRVIKGDWKFPGVVVSDWRAISTDAVYRSGLDLEMPGPGTMLCAEKVREALADGRLTREDFEDRAARVYEMIRNHARDEHNREADAGLLDHPSHRELARRVAEESIVLLKNDGNVLPFDRSTIRRLAVIGPNAAAARLGGGGSASVTPFYSVSPLAGIRQLCGDQIELLFQEGCSLVGSMRAVEAAFDHAAADGTFQPGLLAEFFNQGEPVNKPDASWVVPQVDFSWGWAAPGNGVTRYNFAARFSGRLIPRHSGLHRLGVYGQEGGVRLMLNGKLLVDDWAPLESLNFESNYQTRHHAIEVDFVAGRPVELVLEYGKRAARSAVRLEWEEPGAASPMEGAVKAAASADAVVLCMGLSNLFEGGSRDRQSLDLPEIQVELIRKVAAVNPNTVVVLNSGGPLALPWIDAVPAVLAAFYPGQEGGNALAKLLFGELSPSGRLSDTWAYRLSDYPGMAEYPETGGKTFYREGVFMGYRHFDTAEVEPRFPFGFGLGYTRFEHSEPVLSCSCIAPEGTVECRVGIHNAGVREGMEVVQLYIGPCDAPLPRPEKELKGYQKIRLAPGESRVVSFTIHWRDLAHWCPDAHAWRTHPGLFRVMTGPHSRACKECLLTASQFSESSKATAK
jgi:beta-glucosidase